MSIESPFSNGRKRRLSRDLPTYGVATASALVLGVPVFTSVSAANAELRAKANAEIDIQNGDVCARLGFVPATPGYDRCLVEMNDLRDRDRALQQDVF